MPAYLARLIDDHQLVGIFTVDDDAELFWLIDECCNPNAVEIVELGTGGIYWGKAIPTVIPIPHEDGEPDFDGLPAEASISGQWSETFFADDAELSWRPVPPNNDLDD